MDNASKALIMAGSILISIMVIVVGIYIFRNGQNFTVSVAATTDDAVIASFNSKFSIYETLTGFNSVDEKNQYTATSYLNTIGDVISAVNLAVSVNDENNYSYKFADSRGLETSNAVEVTIDLSAADSDVLDALASKYYSVEPNKDVKVGYVYGQTSLGDDRATRIKSFSTTDEVSCNTLLSLLNESNLIFNDTDNQNYTVYKYYFTGVYEIDELTTKINSVQFVLIKNSGFVSN